MSFRRLPFQFSTTDPVERQLELERRFGLPSTSSRNMFVDVPNPLSAGTVPRDSSISSNSPRLQHRVPIFVDGYDHPINTSVDSSGAAFENKKPNVRVIPIEVEGAETRPSVTRHRTFSGPAGVAKEQNDSYGPKMNEATSLKHSMVDLSQPSMTKSSTLPRVHNIPIQVEGTRNSRSPKVEKVAKSPKLNGCTITKPKMKSPEKNQKRKPEPPKVQAKVEKQENAVESALKKIENVLIELKEYEAGVQEFSGTTKEKQYRYLDEMLTRCMLKMDEIDTMGNENVRSARKSAVKKIQACIDLLENKANAVNRDPSLSQNEVKTSEETANISTESHNGACLSDVEMTESQTAEQGAGKISMENVDETVLQKSDEMVQDVNIVTVENCDISQKEIDFQKGDIEMAENQNIDPVVCESKQISSEVDLPQDVTNEIKNIEKASAELASEVPEVEMAEIKRDLSSQNLASEIPEVEMTESIPTKEEREAEIKNLDLTSEKDVEMKDVQNTLDDMKETVTESKSVNCTSSQPIERSESNVSTEVVSNSDVAGHDAQCENDIKTVS